MRSSRPTCRVAACALGAIGLAFPACSAGTHHSPSPPAQSSYVLQFPSVAAAVAVETVQVLVYDGAAQGADCTSLVLARQTHSDTLRPIVATASIPMCDSLKGSGALADLSFGPRAFLAVAQRAGADFLVGCAKTDLEATSSAVQIVMGQAGTQVVPATRCTTLSDHCQGVCQ